MARPWPRHPVEADADLDASVAKLPSTRRSSCVPLVWTAALTRASTSARSEPTGQSGKQRFGAMKDAATAPGRSSSARGGLGYSMQQHHMPAVLRGA
jgi:hypothetical protein